jgi:hypothetical protein
MVEESQIDGMGMTRADFNPGNSKS